MQATHTHGGSRERVVATSCRVCSRTTRPGIQFCEGCGNNLSPTGTVQDLQEMPPPVAPPPMLPPPPAPPAPIATTASTPAAPAGTHRRSWVGRLALALLVLLPVAAAAGVTLLDTPGGSGPTRSQTTAGSAPTGRTAEEPAAPDTEDEPASGEATEPSDPGPGTQDGQEPVAEAGGHYVPADLDQWIVDAVREREQQWAAVFPATFGFEYEPVDDVIVFDHSVDGTNNELFAPCGFDEEDGAYSTFFHCAPPGNYIAIDRERAGAIVEAVGTPPLAFTISHEVAHAVQERLGLPRTVPTLMRELQADCLAGVFVAPEMERIVANAVTGRRRSGTPTDHPDFDVRTHGSPDEREAAIRHGIETKQCLDYPEGLLAYTDGSGYLSPESSGVIGPTPVDPPAVQQTQSLDPLADPTFRTVELSPWFAPDPLAMSLGPASLAGFVDVGPVGTGCRGTTQAAPDVRVEWQGGTSPFLGVTATADATIGLVVLDPRGQWHCAVGSQAAVRIADDPNEHLAASGTYEIWVTRIDPGVDDVTLSVTENDGRGLLDPLREAFQTVALEPGFQPDPFEVATQSGRGHVNPKYLGAGCRGSAIDRAHLGIDWEGGPGAFLRIYATSPADLGLVVLDPDGRWHCADDSYGPHPSVDVPGGGQPGTYQVWVTNKSDTGTVGASIFVTELEHQHP